MPVVEPTPHARKRALVRRGTLHSISSDEESPRNSTVSSPPAMPQMPKKGGSISPLTRSYSSFERGLEGKLVTNDCLMDDDDDIDDKVDAELMFKGRPKAYTLPPGLLRKQVNWEINEPEEGSDNSDRRSSASSNGSDTEPRRLSSICPPDLSTISEIKEVEPTDSATSSHGAEENDDNVATPVTKEKKDSTSLDRINDYRSGRQYSIYNKYTNPNLDYDISEYKTMAPTMLQEVLVWDFSIDQLEKNSTGVILSRVSVPIWLLCSVNLYCVHCRWHIAFSMKLV